jgi:hypothetical protein
MPPDPSEQAPGIERIIREVNGALLSKRYRTLYQSRRTWMICRASFVPDRFLLSLILALLPSEIVPTLISAGPLDG